MGARADQVGIIYGIRASYFLGQALEQKRDTAGACAAYKVVLDRWGNAKPRSVTADKVKERVKALGCTLELAAAKDGCARRKRASLPEEWGSS